MLLILAIIIVELGDAGTPQMDFRTELQRLKDLKNAPILRKPDDSRNPISELDIDLSHIDPRKGKTGTVALLFVIIDKMPHEQMWRDWMEGYPVDVFIHAKYPGKVTSEWVRKHLVFSDLQPEWGSLDIVRAELWMLETALRVSDARKFCFASESCVPVRPCKDLIGLSDKRSVLKMQWEPENGYAESGQFAPLREFIVPEKIAKASQWLILCRQDASVISCAVNDTCLLEYFRYVHCADEMFFPTTLQLLGCDIDDRATTYVKWASDCEHSPEWLEKEDLQRLKKERIYFFARKFLN